MAIGKEGWKVFARPRNPHVNKASLEQKGESPLREVRGPCTLPPHTSRSKQPSCCQPFSLSLPNPTAASQAHFIGRVSSSIWHSWPFTSSLGSQGFTASWVSCCPPIPHRCFLCFPFCLPSDLSCWRVSSVSSRPLEDLHLTA